MKLSKEGGKNASPTATKGVPPPLFAAYQRKRGQQSSDDGIDEEEALGGRQRQADSTPKNDFRQTFQRFSPKTLVRWMLRHLDSSSKKSFNSPPLVFRLTILQDTETQATGKLRKAILQAKDNKASVDIAIQAWFDETQTRQQTSEEKGESTGSDLEQDISISASEAYRKVSLEFHLKPNGHEPLRVGAHKIIKNNKNVGWKFVNLRKDEITEYFEIQTLRLVKITSLRGTINRWIFEMTRPLDKQNAQKVYTLVFSKTQDKLLIDDLSTKIEKGKDKTLGTTIVDVSKSKKDKQDPASILESIKALQDRLEQTLVNQEQEAERNLARRQSLLERLNNSAKAHGFAAVLDELHKCRFEAAEDGGNPERCMRRVIQKSKFLRKISAIHEERIRTNSVPSPPDWIEQYYEEVEVAKKKATTAGRPQSPPPSRTIALQFQVDSQGKIYFPFFDSITGKMKWLIVGEAEGRNLPPPIPQVATQATSATTTTTTTTTTTAPPTALPPAPSRKLTYNVVDPINPLFSTPSDPAFTEDEREKAATLWDLMLRKEALMEKLTVTLRDSEVRVTSKAVEQPLQGLMNVPPLHHDDAALAYIRYIISRAEKKEDLLSVGGGGGDSTAMDLWVTNNEIHSVLSEYKHASKALAFLLRYNKQLVDRGDFRAARHGLWVMRQVLAEHSASPSSFNFEMWNVYQEFDPYFGIINLQPSIKTEFEDFREKFQARIESKVKEERKNQPKDKVINTPSMWEKLVTLFEKRNYWTSFLEPLYFGAGSVEPKLSGRDWQAEDLQLSEFWKWAEMFSVVGLSSGLAYKWIQPLANKRVMYDDFPNEYWQMSPNSHIDSPQGVIGTRLNGQRLIEFALLFRRYPSFPPTDIALLLIAEEFKVQRTYYTQPAPLTLCYQDIPKWPQPYTATLEGYSFRIGDLLCKTDPDFYFYQLNAIVIEAFKFEYAEIFLRPPHRVYEMGQKLQILGRNVSVPGLSSNDWKEFVCDLFGILNAKPNVLKKLQNIIDKYLQENPFLTDQIIPLEEKKINSYDEEDFENSNLTYFRPPLVQFIRRRKQKARLHQILQDEIILNAGLKEKKKFTSTKLAYYYRCWPLLFDRSLTLTPAGSLGARISSNVDISEMTNEMERIALNWWQGHPKSELLNVEGILDHYYRIRDFEKVSEKDNPIYVQSLLSLFLAKAIQRGWVTRNPRSGEWVPTQKFSDIDPKADVDQGAMENLWKREPSSMPPTLLDLWSAVFAPIELGLSPPSISLWKTAESSSG